MEKSEMGKLVVVVAGAFPNLFNTNLAPTVEAWHKVLGHLHDDVVTDAAMDVLDSAKQFPAPSQVLERARELLQEKSQPKLLNRGMTPEGSELLQKAMQAIASGTWKEMRNSYDISEVLNFMRNTYPNISEEIVRKNYPECRTYMDKTIYCLNCGGVGVCPDNHSKMELELLSSGWMRVLMTRCNYVVEVKRSAPAGNRSRKY